MSYNQLAIASTLLRRKDFIGRTDKYLNVQSQLSPYQKALEGLDVYSPDDGMLSESFRDMTVQRIQRYRESWRWYNGFHYESMFEEGERKLVMNYCDTIVDKGCDWFIADGFQITSIEGNEGIAQLLNSVFKSNRGNLIMRQALQFGAVTGDSYLYVTIDDMDENDKLLPKDQWKVRVDPINPAFVHPFYRPERPDEIAACLIQYPITLKVNAVPTLFSLFITKDTFEVWIDNKSQGKVKNPFGTVNVVHIPNIKIGTSNFGVSDIEAVVPLQRELNDVSNQIRRIIKYHAEPTTIIYGVRVSDLEKGSKKIWSGLPGDNKSKVENLQMEGDLAATFQWWNQIKKEIAIKGEIPFILLDSDKVRLSNTSGLAMQMLFQPLINKTLRKRQTYTKGILDVCNLILIAHSEILGEDLTLLADSPDQLNNLGVDFTSPLPRDDAAELDVAVKKVDAGIWSQAEAIRRISGVTDLRRLSIELAADKRAQFAEALELARAAQMEQPNLSAAFLGSPYLSEDLTMLAEGSVPKEETQDQTP